MTRRRSIILSLLCLLALPGRADTQPTIRVLAIGNSFTVNATRFLADMDVADSAVTLQVGRAVLGGCSLERHWSLVEQSEADPTVKPYAISGVPGTGKLSLREYLELLPWDYVTLQQVSYLSIDYATYQPYLDRLAAYIRLHAPQARILIHQTWAYRPEHPWLAENHIDQQTMFDRLRQAYERAAGRIGADIIPVGAAFQNARTAPGHRATYPVPGFDPKTATYPHLPDEPRSLIVSYSWNAGGDQPKLRSDLKHANIRGCYLAGAVWYEHLTGRDIRDNLFRPEEIDEADCQWLRAIAHQTVAANRSPREPQSAHRAPVE